MKHALGKLWIFFCFVLLQAEDFTYAFHVNNPTPYIKESVILTLDVNQSNPNVVLLFDFDLQKSKDYTFQRIGIQENDAHHAMQVHYTYLIYPLRSGDLNITFSMTKKVTSDDSVAYSFSGDRDNVKGLVTKDFKIDFNPVTLRVKPLPAKTQIVGDFTLEYQIKTHQAKAYEALPLKIILKGKGYPPVLENLLPNDVNFTLFAEKPTIHSTIDKQELYSSVTYAMALAHSQNFTLPALALKAFNPKTEKSYTLTHPSEHFHITKVDSATLVDRVDTPPALESNWSWVQNTWGYLIVFMAGFLTARTLKWQKRSTLNTENPLIQKIQNSKDPKALLQLLMAQDSHRFASCIQDLENTLYQDAKINLSKIKKEAIDAL